MPALKNDKFKDYTRYAEHCLNMMASTTDARERLIIISGHLIGGPSLHVRRNVLGIGRK
jgi:hypothetical protein